MIDITPDLAVDNTTVLTQEFLNKNVRDALQLILSEPTCIVQQNTPQTIAASAAWTAISWDTLIADTEDPASPIFAAGNPTRLTCRTAGWYEVSAMFGLSPPAISHTFSIAFRVNADAAKIYSGDSTPAGNAAQYKVGCFDTLISLALNDYVEMLVRTSYTSTQSSSIGRNGPRLSFRRMRGI